MAALLAQAVEDLGGGADHGDAAAGEDAFFDRGAAGVQGVLDAGLLFLHGDFGGGADVDLGHAAGQLGQAFLEFLAVVIAGGVVDLGLEGCSMRPLMAFSSPAPSMIVVLSLSMRIFLARPSWLEFDVLQLDAEFLEDGGAAGDDGDVFEHGLAAIAKAGGLDGGDLQRAAELVDDQGRQGFAFDILGDDEHGLALLGRLGENGDQVAGGGNLLLVNQDVGVLEHGFHGVRHR